MTGPAEAMSPPPFNVTEAVTPELKVYLLSLVLILSGPGKFSLDQKWFPKLNN